MVLVLPVPAGPPSMLTPAPGSDQAGAGVRAPSAEPGFVAPNPDVITLKILEISGAVASKSLLYSRSRIARASSASSPPSRT